MPEPPALPLKVPVQNFFLRSEPSVLVFNKEHSIDRLEPSVLVFNKEPSIDSCYVF